MSATVVNGERVNVLFLMIQMAMGGSERLVCNLVRHLDRKKFAPSIAWFAQERPLEEFQDLDVPLHYIPKTSGLDWRAMRQLARLVRGERIDIINAHHFMPLFYAAYAARIANRIGLVYTEHSEADVLSVAGRWKTFGGPIVRTCDAAIGVTERVSKTLVSHFSADPERVHAIENGVDFEFFAEAGARRALTRRQHGFAADDVVIGIVANFRRNKNHLFLLRAFRELARTRRDVHLVLVGQGFPGDPENSEPEIAAFVRDHGLETRVRLVGYLSDVREVLSGLDVFCLVSHKEGLPLSVLEGMAAGLPVIATDIEGLRQVVQPERNGLLVAPDDVAGLSAGLMRLAGDPTLRRIMGEASRRIAADQYSLQQCVERTERLFLSTLPAPRYRIAPVHPASNGASPSPR